MDGVLSTGPSPSSFLFSFSIFCEPLKKITSEGASGIWGNQGGLLIPIKFALFCVFFVGGRGYYFKGGGGLGQIPQKILGQFKKKKIII